MKTINVVVVAVLLGLAGTGSAWAQHGGGHGGGHWGGHGGGHWGGHGWGGPYIGIGVGPYWGPWPGYYGYPYPYPYDYYPPVVVPQSAPPVYVEQGNPQPAPAAPAAAWFYCSASRSYYPYVQQCPGGWQQVAPQPPQPPQP